MYVARTLIILSSLCLSAACTTRPPSTFSVLETTIAEIQQATLAGQVSCSEVIQQYLDRIADYDDASGVNAITVINPNALAKAQATDAAISRGDILPELFCTPVLIKDNFDTHDLITSGGSITLIDNYPPDDAFMVRKLREAGAIVIAKTNMAEWAFSPRESVSSSFGRTANAYDINYVPAGSSGGTASGVAASFGVAGMGSDTGNSIRGPSSHLALFGIRSTIGLTSRDGVIPLIFDRDIAGPMARTVEDGVRLFNVVAGYDPADSLTLPNKREADYREFLNVDGLEGKRIGVLRALVDHDDADTDIKQLFLTALADMEAAGAIIIDNLEISNFAELERDTESCGSFRYDLGRYLQTLDAPPFIDVASVLESGEFVPASRDGLEFFTQHPLALSPEERPQPCAIWPNHPQRNELLANTIAAMDAANVDVLVYPTWSNPPAAIDQATEQYKGDNNQFLAPTAGLPAVTVPMGFWQNKLPAGLQMLGRPYAEGILIEAAYSYEQHSNHRRPPSGFSTLP